MIVEPDGCQNRDAVTRRVRPRSGDFVSIALAGGGLAFARVMKSPLVAFYDFTSPTLPDLADLADRPVAFKIWVMKSAFSRPGWAIIGHGELPPDLQAPVRFFKKDAISEKFSHYCEGI